VNTLQTACAGSTVVNKGVSGSTATDWNGDTELTDAFAEGSGWTHVWVTLGANDLSLDCSLTKAAIKGRLETTVSLIKAIQSDINIVFTGYCIAAVDESCGLSAYYDKVAVAQREIAAADSAVTFVDIAETCGGTIDPMTNGDSQYFEDDGLHLNQAGYERVWAMSGAQQAFGCNGASPSPSSPSPSSSPTPSPSTDDSDDDSEDVGGLTDSASMGGSLTAVLLVAATVL